MQMNSLDDFIESMPTNLNNIVEKTRHLYLELGKRSFYDPEYKYFMFGEEEECYYYTQKSYSNPNIIICTTLAKQFIELLAKAGIKAELVYEEGHYLVRFYDENGDYHLADITNDLKNIQFGCRTTYFAPETIPVEQLENIDRKLGYITQTRSYTDDYWYVVKDTLQNSELGPKKKLEIVLNNLQKYGDISKPGDTEIFSIYQKFIRYCLPDVPNILFCSNKNKRYEKEKCFIELYLEDGKVNYLLNPTTRLFEEVKRLSNDTLDTPFAPQEDVR